VKVKLDENIGRRGAELLAAAGHDVMTVRDQGLGGTTDSHLFEVCVAEDRVLVTLDRDFGHVSRFPPELGAGIVVLELGPRATIRALLERLRAFLSVAETRPVHGALWIVEPGRVRIHLRDHED
jgi:predicted nuclease of predicted toxin-antitoxin system